jgi:CheY-like chemotaxis protein
MRLVLQNALTLVFAAALLGVVADAAVAHRNIGDLAEAAGSVSQSHEIQDAVVETTPQVVLLDIGMPGMDGYEVARRLRQTSGFDSTPIVAMTGFGSAEDHRRSREAGFNQHLSKPVDPETLLDLLARV